MQTFPLFTSQSRKQLFPKCQMQTNHKENTGLYKFPNPKTDVIAINYSLNLNISRNYGDLQRFFLFERRRSKSLNDDVLKKSILGFSDKNEVLKQKINPKCKTFYESFSPYC